MVAKVRAFTNFYCGLRAEYTTKPKAEPKPAASTSTAAPAAPSTPAAAAPSAPVAPVAPAAPAPAAAAAPQPPNAPILTPAQAAPVPAPAQSTRAFDDENAFVTGAELQSTVQNMMEMGFERDQVMRALRASYNNPDRAVEYLFNVRLYNCTSSPAG